MDSANMIFDFTGSNNPVGMKYICSNSMFFCGYDGVRYLSCMPGNSAVSFIDNPDRLIITRNVFLMNSFYVLHSLLPTMIKDSSVNFLRMTDSIISGVDSYRYAISLRNKVITPEIIMMNNEVESSKYNLCISKKTGLPIMFSMLFNGGSWDAYYDSIKTNSVDSKFVFNSDYYNSLLTNRKIEIENKIPDSAGLAIGDLSPDWTLPSLNGEQIKLSALKGNVVVLEFWFPGCAGCLAAIPKMNNIYQKYLKKGLNIFGVEFTNAKSSVLKTYVNKNMVQYPILYSAETVSKSYSVTSAPTIFLIDKQGVIRYISMGFKKAELIKAIEDAI
jgi:peroxiredoxin